MRELALIRPQNITSDHFNFFPRKKMKGKPVEQIYSTHKKLTENCKVDNGEENITRDIFIANRIDGNTQRVLQHDTIQPVITLSNVKEKEVGQQPEQRHHNTIIQSIPQRSIHYTTTPMK